MTPRFDYAVSHLAFPCLPAGRAAGLFRAAENPAVAALADRGFILLLRLVESLLSFSRSLFHGARLLPGGAHGSLPARRAEGGCASAFDAVAVRCPRAESRIRRRGP